MAISTFTNRPWPNGELLVHFVFAAFISINQHCHKSLKTHTKQTRRFSKRQKKISKKKSAECTANGIGMTKHFIIECVQCYVKVIMTTIFNISTFNTFRENEIKWSFIWNKDGELINKQVEESRFIEKWAEKYKKQRTEFTCFGYAVRIVCYDKLANYQLNAIYVTWNVLP